jgi:hypothetical protein
MNRNHKIMFLLASLIVLLVGVSAVSAVDSASNMTVEQVTATNTQIDNQVADTQDNVKVDNNNIKTIEKSNKNIKTGPETSVDYYVSDSLGSDENDGSQDAPFKTIGAAIDKTTADNVYNIYIKEGTYKGVGNTNLTVNGEYFINFIGDGVDKTIIDGDLNYTINPNPGFVWGSSEAWWPWVNTTGNWFMNITAGNGSFKISDFKVQNCYSSSGSSIAACYTATIDNYANLNATNIYFYHNSAGCGAGIRNGYLKANPAATLYVDNCTFDSNLKATTTGNFGAAVYNNATAVINNSVVINNLARWGSVTTDKTLYVYNTYFANNIGYDGSSTYKNGPTIYANTGNADFYAAYDTEGLLLHVEGCTFEDNQHVDITYGKASSVILNNIFNHSTGIYLTAGNNANYSQVIANNQFIDMQPSTLTQSMSSTTKPSWGVYSLSSIPLLIENNTIDVPDDMYGYGIYTTNNATIRNNTLNNNIYITGKNNTIENNTVNTTKDFAVQGTNAATNNTIDNNTLYSSSGDGDFALSVNTNNKIADNLPKVETYNITDETYSQYFDENGVEIAEKFQSGSKVNLIDAFNNKNFTFNTGKLTVVGVNTTLNNASISVIDDAQILLDNVTINNMNVSNEYAVLFNSSAPSKMTRSKVIVDTDSNINAIILSSDNNKLQNVSVTIDAKDVATQWVEVDGVWVGLGNTIGIAVRSSNNYINLTNVTIRAKDNSDAYSSVYGIDIQSGNPNIILTDNTLYNVRINASSVNTGYSYGVNAIGIKDTTSSMLWINATSDFYAYGLQLSGESTDNVLAGYLYASAGDTAYGAYVSNMGGNGINNNNLSKLYLQDITAKNAVGFQLEGINNTLIGNITNAGLNGQQNTIVNITNSNNTVLYGITYNNKVDTNENSTFVIAKNIDGIQVYLNSWNSTAGKGIILNNAQNINISNNYFNLYNSIGGDDVVVTDNPDAILVNNTPSIKVITEETYSNFFDENGVLKEDVTANILTIGSDIYNKDMIINRDVNLKNAGSYVLYNTTLTFNGSWPQGNYASPKTNITGIIIDNVDKPAIVTDFDNDYQYNLMIEDSSITVTGENVVAVNSTQTKGKSYVYLSLNRDNITVTGNNATVLVFSGNQTGSTSVSGVGEIKYCTINVAAEDTSIVFDVAKANAYFTYNRITQSGANAYTIKAENYGMDDWQYNNITITADNATAFKGENKVTTYTEYIRYNNINITSKNPTTAISMINSQRISVNYYNNITVSSNNGQTPVVLLEGANTIVTNNYIAANDLFGDEAASAASVSKNRPDTETTITAEATEVPLGENTTVTGTVTVGSTPLANAVINITSGDEVVETTTASDGSFTASIRTFADSPEITISAPVSPNGKPANKTITVNTLKANTKITIEPVSLKSGQTVTLKALITASDDSIVNVGKVAFKVNGKTLKDENGKVIYAKVENGEASINYTVAENMNGKTLNISAVYSGSTSYNKSSESINETVTDTESEPTFTTTDMTAKAGDTITLTATITNGNSDMLSGRVIFKVNGKTVKDENGKVIYAKVDANGVVTVPYKIPSTFKAQNYTITAVLTSKNSKYTDTKTLTVTKA